MPSSLRAKFGKFWIVVIESRRAEPLLTLPFYTYWSGRADLNRRPPAPKAGSSFRASSGVGPCDVPFRYASKPTPCGCQVARPSSRSRDSNSSNIRTNFLLYYLKRWQFPIIASRFVASFLSHQLQGTLPQSITSLQLTALRQAQDRLTAGSKSQLTADERRPPQT